MTPYQSIQIKNHLVLFIIFLCWALYGGCASSPEIKVSESNGGNDFQKQYRAFQGYASAGYTVIQRHEYSKALEHYTLAIEMSPFVASHHYYQSLA